jgi:hypothetical protein
MDMDMDIVGLRYKPFTCICTGLCVRHTGCIKLRFVYCSRYYVENGVRVNAHLSWTSRTYRHCCICLSLRTVSERFCDISLRKDEIPDFASTGLLELRQALNSRQAHKKRSTAALPALEAAMHSYYPLGAV